MCIPASTMCHHSLNSGVARSRMLPAATAVPRAAALVRLSRQRLLLRAVPASIASLPAPVAVYDKNADPYTQLAELCGAGGPVAVGQATRGRGLLLQQDMPEREALLTVPLYNALIIADDPTDSISIFSDKQHRRWQELHGDIPPLLLEFLQGDARWDARMAGWLLWMVQHPSPLWRAYLALLPAESDMSCLLNFSKEEIQQLQVPRLKEEAAVQASWCAHLHAKYFSSATGSLAPLNLSNSLAHSLWAISLVRSRTFSEDVNGEMLTLMVPYCDMANHCSNHNSTFCISKDFKSFSLRSLRPLSKGEELTITYGAEKPNCESLRDYGFVMSGNSHDRIRWAHTDSTDKAAGGAQAEGGGSSCSSVYGLNEACLMESAGFQGDLASEDIQPLQSTEQPTTDQQQQLARREAVLLSLPLKNANSSNSSGGLLGWLDAAAQPWTDSGKPPPQPLHPYQTRAEVEAVQALQQQLQQQLAELPTSIQEDEELLQQIELHGASAVLGSNNTAGHAASSNDSSSSETVQQRRQGRLKQQEGAAPKPMQPAHLVDDRPLSTARLMTAVRARMEHKLLLQEGLAVLQQYQEYLTARFTA